METFRKVQFCGSKVQICGSKVQFCGSKVQFFGSKVQFGCLKFQTSLQISNITSGEEIIKSTLFCKVRFVLYSGINSLKGTFSSQIRRLQRWLSCHFRVKSSRYSPIGSWKGDFSAENATFQCTHYLLELLYSVGTFGHKRNGVCMGGQVKKKRSTMVNLISF